MMEKPFHLYEYLATLVSVYDGDTIKVNIDLGLRTWRHDETIRLLGIDTPEIRGPERPLGILARDRLREILAKNQSDRLLLKTEKDSAGKFGRWLAEVFTWDGEKWTSANQTLLDEGHAEKYRSE